MSDTVKLFGSKTTLSVCVLSLVYSIFPLAVFPGPFTMFSSIRGWTVCAKTGVAESKKEDLRPGKHFSRAAVRTSKKNWLSRPSRLRCGLRLDVKRADVSIRGQLRNHGRVNLVGQRIRPAAGLVRASDGNGRTNLQSGGRGVERADGGQSTIRASATNLNFHGR